MGALPGAAGIPPLIIPSPRFTVHFHSGSGSAAAASTPPTGEIVAGTRVMLSADYSSHSDASEGPLQPGQVDVVERVGGSGRRSVRGWWYDLAALQHASVSGTAAAAAVSVSGTPALTADGRIPVGATVILTPDYASHGDARDGPLMPGDTGTLVKDDRDHKPYKVRATSGEKVGREWWYDAGAICLAAAAAPDTGTHSLRITHWQRYR